MESKAATTRRRRFYAKLAAATIFLVAIAMPLLYVAQTCGVCLKAGRVLDAEELRRRVLLNFVDYNIQDIVLSNKGYDTSLFWLGIASPAQETDIRKLVEISFHNDQSIEENFGLEMLVRGRKDIPARNFDMDGVKEPFLLMRYYVGDWGMAFVSSDIQEIQVTDKQLGGYQPDWHKRLLGYGNHYFSIPYSSVSVRCCDNRGISSAEYVEKKRRAYIDTLSMLDFRAKLAAEYPAAAVISNCGGLLLIESNESGFSHDIIKRVLIKGA